jgi:hypothetical protein
MRCFISPAAASVKVTARMRSGRTVFDRTQSVSCVSMR